MKHMIRISILVITIVVSLSFTSMAYTEEQKQQAKAWLSAHGYSPDWGGANQAYQDYLNGKFDEELGVDVNGDGIPATSEATTEANTEESTEDYVDAETEEEENTEEDEADDTADTSSGMSVESEEETTDAGVAEDDTKEQAKEESVEGISEEMAAGDVDEKPDADTHQEHTLYQPEKQEEYQEAAMVILLSVVLMILAGMWLKK